MVEKEDQFDNGNPKPNIEKESRKKTKKKKQLVKETPLVNEKVEENEKPNNGKEGSIKIKKKKKKHLLMENVESVLEEKGVFSIDDGLVQGKKDRENKSLVKADKGEEGKEEEVIRTSAMEEENPQSNDNKADIKKKKRKRRLLKEAAEADKRGICYLSRIPPHMDPFKLRQILSQFGDIQRIYLTPENPAVQVRRKPGGRFQEQAFSEGWVEFSDKRVAKRTANMLNGEQIGGRKRSSFYYDLWNIKYLSKFKWDDLTEEIAYKFAIREQKLALEISAAKREREFYLSKVDQACALRSIEERLKKKQKLQQESGTSADLPVSQQTSKVVRKFPQRKPVADNTAENKPRLSKDILAGVFGGS